MMQNLKKLSRKKHGAKNTLRVSYAVLQLCLILKRGYVKIVGVVP